MPLVSVIVPVYNAAPYLVQCIESLLCQTHRDLQIILVDDGSTDSSLEIVKQYAAEDERITHYSQSHGGQSAARNLGLHYATGDYISFIDSDDYLDIDFYEVLLSAFRPDTDVVQIGYRRVQDGKVLTEQTPHTFYHYTAPWSRLYRRDFFIQHHLSFAEGIIYEDVVFSLDVWGARPNYRLLHYTGYNYRLNPKSTTSTRRQDAERVLFRCLRTKYHATLSLFSKCLILYTYLRLKVHFAFFSE